MRWLSHWKNALFPERAAGETARCLPDEILALLPEKRASALREPLEQACKNSIDFPRDDLIESALQAGYDSREVEKLRAYVEFFSGQSAQGYWRVFTNRLATGDYTLFKTACVYCYLHGRFEEGYFLVEQFDPACADACNECEYLAFAGYLALASGRSIEVAAAYFDQALDKGYLSPLLVGNAHPIYFEAGRHERVDRLRRLMHEHFPDDPEIVFAIAYAELAKDYYPEGFRLAEARYRMPAEADLAINASLLSKSRWQGEPLAGQRLLASGEQGLGDIVMMARYLPLLTAQGAEVIVDCREEVISLLAHNFPACTFVARDLKKPVTIAFDAWTGVMSLPFYFNTTADSVPSTAAYLTVPPEQAAYWHVRVSELSRMNVPRVGLAWSGNPAHRSDKRRSISFDRISSYLREYSNIQFFSLQTSAPPQHLGNLVVAGEEMLTLADTAALIAEMDLVITVDTSVVHIAGALGKTTWLLLPHRYEWRWSLEGEKNNWYDSVKVLRQKTHGDWDGLLADVFGYRLGKFMENLALSGRDCQ